MPEPRKPPWIRPCTWVYLTLMALTGPTYLVGRSGLSGLSISLPILSLALIKDQRVGDYLMGLKWVRGPWRWVIPVWLLLSGGLVAIASLLATP